MLSIIILTRVNIYCIRKDEWDDMSKEIFARGEREKKPESMFCIVKCSYYRISISKKNDESYPSVIDTQELDGHKCMLIWTWKNQNYISYEHSILITIN